MISSTIALAMAGLAVMALLQIRSAVNRAEARLAMHDSVRSIYVHMQSVFAAVQQSCALVTSSTAKNSGVNPDPGEVTLIFMHGKESSEDWRWGLGGKLNQVSSRSDLTWERWTWRRATRTLYWASSTPLRRFTSGGLSYENLPQPRRTLGGSLATLDDNRIFKLSTVAGDFGDGTDLEANLVPALANVSEFGIQTVAHDGTVLTVEDGSTTMTERPGVWLDGRVAALGDLPSDADFTNASVSGAAKRPRLVRIRFVVLDPRIGLTQTFSFSFALPGMTGTP